MLPLSCKARTAPLVASACTRSPSPLLPPLAGSRFWSAGCGSTFRQLSSPFRRVPLISRCRPLTQAIHFAFDSLRRVKPTTCSGLHATPDSFRLNQNPLAAYRLRQAPVLIAGLRYRSRFMVGQVRLDFLGYSPISVQSASPSRASSPLEQALRHCFRSLCAGVARPHPRSGCNPCPSKRDSTPRAPAGAQVPVVSACPCGRAFRLSSVRLSSISRFPSAVFQPHGSQGRTGLVICLASSPAVCSVCILPLLTSRSSAS